MINCKNLIVANFALENAIFTRYLDVLTTTFNSMEDSKNHQLEVVTREQFVNKVLSDPKNSGICLATSGVKQCVELNQCKGIRAAVVHTKYIAKMCRQHNDSNVVIIGTDCISDNLAGYLVECYLLNGFDNGEKNKIRIQIMKDLEEKYLTK